ncbi:MAG: xanthine dehydrogenase family protein molybdopterin-binding subunit [Anaerolineae bacterium]|nr:xanthine dehydrogenase family protein molybdopterin-binding subunit [Anaerolineae bacterium]
MTRFQAIGRPTPLLDGRERVTGQLRYAPDLSLPGMVHGRFVTSPYPHARIVAVDKTTALSFPGVVAVLTADDLPDIPPDNRPHLLLARGRVIFPGQPVALVLAETAAAAADAIELVLVDYEPLPAAATITELLAPGAPLVWPGGKPGDTGEAAAHGADVATGGEERGEPSNIGNQNSYQRGNIEDGLTEADIIVERHFTIPFVHHSYLETQATIVMPDPLSGGATVWTSTQAPFPVREGVANVLGVRETDVRVIATPVGGGFGGKYELYQPLAALVARVVGRPVKLVLTRQEDMAAANPAPASQFHLKLGGTHDGKITALWADIKFDEGCYPGFHGIAAFLLGSAYQIPNLLINFTSVLSFKPSVGAYRAPGAVQAFYALESTLDDLARQLNLDPLTLRQKYASLTGDPMANGRPWSKIGLHEVLETVQQHPAWVNREQARAQGRGIGVAVGGWPGGVEPSSATCLLEKDGLIELRIGWVDLTGTAVGFQLLAAEAFGVSPERVRVVAGDTATSSFAGSTGGSKATYMIGPSVIQAAQAARAQTLEIAGQMFEADPADLEIVNGAVQVRGVPDKQITLKEIAQKTMQFGSRYAPVVGQGRYANTTNSPGFCAQLAEVSVDEETGQVLVHRLVLVQDVGQVINPLTLRGQIVGGAMQGVGFALYEGLVYGENGQLLTGSWMDYTVPNFAQAVGQIEVVTVEVASEHGPYGAKGAGEPPIIATAAAIANAIRDATGKRVTDLPMTPPRVLAVLQADSVSSQ